MNARIKMFTFVSGHGETLVEPPHEERINQWLESAPGEITRVTQSESRQASGGHHVTVCVWYLSKAEANASSQVAMARGIDS